MRPVLAPHLGRTVVVGGRKRPPAPKPGETRLSLARYFKVDALPAPPDAVDYTPKADAALGRMYCNDRLGCCVIAGFYHCLGVLTGNATGSPLQVTDQQIVEQYSAIGGYKPTDPSTDQGCDEWSALQYWKDQGAVDGSKLAGFIAVDACNVEELKLALWLFGNLYFGFELPDAWLSPFPSQGGTWDVAGDPNPNHGHCVMGAAYDAGGVTIGTWGMKLRLTWAAIAKYGAQDVGGQVFTFLSPDWLPSAQAAAPSGVDWDSLRADLDALATPAPPLP